MLATISVTLVVLLTVCGALALGQFFGREPITPKCNPGPCCLQGKNCKRRKLDASMRDRDA